LREKSLQIAGGRTWIRTPDLFAAKRDNVVSVMKTQKKKETHRRAAPYRDASCAVGEAETPGRRPGTPFECYDTQKYGQIPCMSGKVGGISRSGRFGRPDQDSSRG